METLPASFKHILWSYDLSSLDIEQNSREITVNALNYGSLEHWRWIANNYGARVIRQVINQAEESEIRPGVKRLAEIIFKNDE